VMGRTSEGRAFRMLTIVDEYSRECLAIDVARKVTSEDVLERLSDSSCVEASRSKSAATTGVSSGRGESGSGSDGSA